MSKTWNKKNIQKAEKPEETWNEDRQLPEGSGVILGEDWQKAEELQGSRKEIGEDLVDLVIGGLADTYSQSTSRRKRKRDDILLPEI